MSYVTLDRICQEKVDKEGVLLELVRNGRPLRSSADALSDDELLAKLKELGLDVDRDGVERLCAGALSAEEVARPVAKKLNLDDMVANWVLDLLAALWQTVVAGAALPGATGRQDAGRVRPGRGERHARGGRDLAGWWADVLRLCDVAGISSIEEFDGRFSLTQFLCNSIQDLEMALENAGRDDGELRQALIEFGEESLRRFPSADR